MRKTLGNPKKTSNMPKNYLSNSRPTTLTNHSIECHCTLPNKPPSLSLLITIEMAKSFIVMFSSLISTNTPLLLAIFLMVALSLTTRYLFLEMERLSQYLSAQQLTLDNVLQAQRESNEMEEATILWIVQFANNMYKLKQDLRHLARAHIAFRHILHSLAGGSDDATAPVIPQPTPTEPPHTPPITTLCHPLLPLNEAPSTPLNTQM